MLDPDHAATIAQLFALGDGARFTGAVVRGEQGQVAQLATDHGLWAVKTSFPSNPPELDGEDAAFQTAALATGVPSPAVVTAAAGEVFADVGGELVRVYGWVEVLDADPTLDPGAVGELLARLHQVPFTGRRPPAGWYSDPVGAAGWDALIAKASSAAAPFAAGLAGLRDELVALEAELVPATELRTCHRDLWADNLRATEAGGLCVIDWDNCGLADPSQELACLLFEFARGDPARAHTLHGAYVGAGGPGRVRSRGDFTMAIAQLGHITEISCRAWLDPKLDAGERDHQAARVREVVDDPLTRDVIDSLLDALAARTRPA
jgi:Ser/Thr protein kinase RdoA (MazF antagonist)